MPAIRKSKKSTRQEEMAPYDMMGASSDSAGEQELDSKRGASRKRMERKGPWLPAEDAVLVALVSRLGAHSWSKIATHIPGRVGKQCRERYYNHLAPEVNKEPWTPEEELKVMKLHAEHGNSWALISRLLSTGRTANDVKNLWNCALKKRMLENGEEEEMIAEVEATTSASSCCTSCKRRSRTDRIKSSVPCDAPALATVTTSAAVATTSPAGSDADAEEEEECSTAIDFCPYPDEAVAAAAAAASCVQAVHHQLQVQAAALAAVAAAQQVQIQQMQAQIQLQAPQVAPLLMRQSLFAKPEDFVPATMMAPCFAPAVGTSPAECTSSPYDSATTVVSPPAASTSPSPFVSPLELCESSASFFDAVPSEGMYTACDNGSQAPAMQADSYAMPSWWSQEFESDGSC